MEKRKEKREEKEKILLGFRLGYFYFFFFKSLLLLSSSSFPLSPLVFSLFSLLFPFEDLFFCVDRHVLGISDLEPSVREVFFFFREERREEKRREEKRREEKRREEKRKRERKRRDGKRQNK